MSGNSSIINTLLVISHIKCCQSPVNKTVTFLHNLVNSPQMASSHNFVIAKYSPYLLLSLLLDVVWEKSSTRY